MSEGERVQVTSSGVGVDGSERRRRQALRNAAIAVAALFAMVLAVAISGSGMLCLATYLPGISALVFLAVAASAYRRPQLTAGAATVEGDRITVRPERSISVELPPEGRTVMLREIAQGYWQGASVVRLVLRSGEALLVRASRDEGDRLLKACGVSAAERVMRVPLAAAAGRVPGGAAILGTLVGVLALGAVPAVAKLGSILKNLGESAADPSGALPPAIALGVLGLLATGIGALVRKREAIVGSDGVVFRGSLRRRFYPFSAIEGASPHPRGVALYRRDGGPVVLPTGAAIEGEAYRAALIERVREGLAGGGGAGALAQAELERLDRRGRSIAEWRAELGKVLAQGGDYRRAAISAADLGAVIEDAGAPAERRIAATVALSAELRDEARRRVRIATQASADDELRRALEQAAEGEIDEALIEAKARRSQR